MLSDISISSGEESTYSNQELLSSTNYLLNLVGIYDKQVSSIYELQRDAANIFVAVYESLFQIALDGIIRYPQKSSDYVRNAQIVIDALGRRINRNLHHISGQSIADGDRLAVSNLMDIFIHIASITGSQMDSTVEDKAPKGKHTKKPRKRSSTLTSRTRSRSTSSGGIDNVKTSSHSHTSFSTTPFLEGKVYFSKKWGDGKREHTRITTPTSTTRPAHSRPKSAGSPYLSPSPAKKVTKSSKPLKPNFFEPGQLKTDTRELKQIIKSHESLIKQNEKLESARRRREAMYTKKSTECHTMNARHRDRVSKISQDRFRESAVMKDKSDELRQQSEEYALLRKIYGGFLNKLRQWYWDEDHEVREREARYKTELLNQMSSLQAVFRDRMDIMKESTEAKNAESRDTNADLRRYETTLKQLVKDEYNKILTRYQEQKDQFRDYQISRRLEGYRHLLEMLKVEKWHDSLRADGAIHNNM